jgi:hypothetical protein
LNASRRLILRRDFEYALRDAVYIRPLKQLREIGAVDGTPGMRVMGIVQNLINAPVDSMPISALQVIERHRGGDLE